MEDETDLQYQWTCMDRVLTDRLYEYWTWLCWPCPSSGSRPGMGWGTTKAEAKRRLQEELAR